MSKNSGGVVILAVLALAAGTARADKYFEIFAFSNNSGSPAVVLTSNSALTHIVGDLMNAQGTLAPIGGNGVAEISPGRPFSQIQNNVPVLIDFTPGTNSAFVAFSHDAAPIVVSNANPTILARDLENVFQDDTKGDWGQEIKALDRTNPNMPTDGNPQSSTAFIANDAFERFGSVETLSRSALTGNDNFNLRLNLDGGFTRASAMSGNYLNLSLDATGRMDDNFALSAATAIQWRTVAGASSYTFGEILGLPITFIPEVAPQTAEEAQNYATPADLNYGFPFDLFQGFSYTLTPWGVAALSASWDEVAGTLLLGGGATSNLTLYNGAWSVSVNDQVSYVVGVGVKIGNYNFNDPINQMVVKNGLGVGWQPGPSGIFVDGSATFTDLCFHNVAVPYYVTPSIGVGFKFNPNSGVRLGCTSDIGPHFTSYGGQLTFWLTF